MPNGSFKLAEQSGTYGFYAEISLVTHDASDGGLAIEFEPTIDDSWKHAIEFGLRYGWRALRAEEAPPNLKVVVESFESNPVDTTDVIAAYVSVHALFDAFGRKTDTALFNPSSGYFGFRK